MSLRFQAMLSVLIPVFVLVMVVFTALSLPEAGGSFEATDGSVYYTDDNVKNARVTAFVHQGVSGSRIPASPELLIEEPDSLPLIEDYRRVLTQVGSVSSWLTADQLALALDDGRLIDISPRQRTLADLRFDFWIQAFSGFLAALICFLVLLLSSDKSERPGRIAFVITGVGFALSSLFAAVYSTRDLFIQGDLFFAASMMNHLGSSLFATGLIAFLWNYPSVLFNSRFAWAIFSLPLLSTFSAQFYPVHPETAVMFYLPYGASLLAALVGLFVQWLKSAPESEERTKVRWIFISVVAGTGVFAITAIVPMLMGRAPLASQSMVLVTFLFMYFGMLFAVIRHRVFDLDPWYVKVWGWIAGGMAILMVDILLTYLLSRSGPETLAISLALVGWLYFPVRQLFLVRLLPGHRGELDHWLRDSLPGLVNDRYLSREERLADAFRTVFSPLDMKVCSGTNPSKNALQLTAADESGEARYVELLHPFEGARNLNDNDYRTAELVRALDDLIDRSHGAHEAGVQSERQRIRRDLHDDMGAKLLTILRRSPAEEQPLVRSAIADLRNLLNHSFDAPDGLEALCVSMQDEAEARCLDYDVPLSWTHNVPDLKLTRNSYYHLERILREALSNALRAGSKSVAVEASVGDKALLISMVNYCKISDPANMPRITQGLGQESMQARAQSIGGEISVKQHDEQGAACWQLVLTVPLNGPLLHAAETEPSLNRPHELS